MESLNAGMPILLIQHFISVSISVTTMEQNDIPDENDNIYYKISNVDGQLIIFFSSIEGVK